MSEHYLIFLPGMMATELRYVGQGRFGSPEDKQVWGGNILSIWDSLAKNPMILQGELQVGKVLRHVDLKLYKYPIYGPFFDFLMTGSGLDYKENVNFFAFAYDWRKDNRESAECLAKFMRKKMREGVKEFKIIAHSMGGIIARLLLANPENGDLKTKIKLFVQIGTPVLGSARAFSSLKDIPDFPRFLESICWLRYMTNPKLYKYLMTSISSFDSIYQLLPPKTEQILVDEIGRRYNALEGRVWPTLADKKKLRGAREVHRIIQNCSFENIKVITLYGTEILTKGDYIVDEHFNIMRNRPSSSKGDGTVTIASSIANTPLDSRIPIADKKVSHDCLPNHDEIKKVLLKELLDK